MVFSSVEDVLFGSIGTSVTSLMMMSNLRLQRICSSMYVTQSATIICAAQKTSIESLLPYNLQLWSFMLMENVNVERSYLAFSAVTNIAKYTYATVNRRL